jgi:hypothetical protein
VVDTGKEVDSDRIADHSAGDFREHRCVRRPEGRDILRRRVESSEERTRIEAVTAEAIGVRPPRRRAESQLAVDFLSGRRVRHAQRIEQQLDLPATFERSTAIGRDRLLAAGGRSGLLRAR